MSQKEFINGVEVKTTSVEALTKKSKSSLRKERQRLHCLLATLKPGTPEYERVANSLKILEVCATQRATQADKILNGVKNVGIVLVGAGGLVLSMLMDSKGCLPRWTNKLGDKLIKF